MQPFSATPPPASPRASNVPSPAISIYPVPRQTSPPGVPTLSPSLSPSPAEPLPDVTGMACGEANEKVDHHVRVLTTYNCYEVSGRTPRQLQAWVAKEGPRANGRVAAAVTHWRLRWSYSLVPGDATCEVARPDVQVLIVYALPAWMPPERTSDATVQYWRDFSALVQAHEENHGSIALEGGRVARESLLDLPPGTTCPGISDIADARVKAIVARFKAKQRAFDKAAGG